MTTTNRSVARNVGLLMRERGLTQAALGDALGLSQTAVSFRLSGRTPFRLSELDELADLFAVDTADLLLASDVETLASERAR